jgi:hypothetical protein
MDMWEAGADVWSVVQDLISKFHPNLALVDKEIAIIFYEKASKSGGQVVLGKSRKASSLFKVLGKGEYKFILSPPLRLQGGRGREDPGGQVQHRQARGEFLLGRAQAQW